KLAVNAGHFEPSRSLRKLYLIEKSASPNPIGVPRREPSELKIAMSGKSIPISQLRNTPKLNFTVSVSCRRLGKEDSGKVSNSSLLSKCQRCRSATSALSVSNGCWERAGGALPTTNRKISARLRWSGIFFTAPLGTRRWPDAATVELPRAYHCFITVPLNL